MARNQDGTGVEITETARGFIAMFYYNSKLIHTTVPQLARANAIMLINRKIMKFNRMHGSSLKPYKELS